MQFPRFSARELYSHGHTPLLLVKLKRVAAVGFNPVSYVNEILRNIKRHHCSTLFWEN